MALKKISILVLAMTFLVSGCGLFRYIDGSSQEEIEQYENPLIWGKVARLERNEVDQKRALEDFERETRAAIMILSQAQTEKDKEMLAMKNQLRAVGTELNMELPGVSERQGVQAVPPRAQSAVSGLKRDTADLKMRVAKLEGDDRQPAAEMPAGKSGKIRIKVLSGTGNLAAAKKMTETLSRYGYKVARVDLAPRSDFKNKIIYYSPGFKKTAIQLKDKLGENVTVKALTWKSSFNLIILAI